MQYALVIVNNLDARWTGGSARPLEANSPLIVNANTVLALAVAYQSFKAIAGQNGQVSERCGRLQTVKLQARGALESRESLGAFAGGEVSGPTVPVADNHWRNMTGITCYVKRNVLVRLCLRGKGSPLPTGSG